jgi:hypothetical protein
MTSEREVQCDVISREIGIVAWPVGRLGDADTENRYARVEEDVVVIRCEEHDGVGLGGLKSGGNLAVHVPNFATELGIFLGDDRKMRVVRYPENSDD